MKYKDISINPGKYKNTIGNPGKKNEFGLNYKTPFKEGMKVKPLFKASKEEIMASRKGGCC